MIVKSCGCGRQITVLEWAKLDLVGHQLDGEGMLELKNCSCGSTLAIEIHTGPGCWAQSVIVGMESVKRDIDESMPSFALTAARNARERLEILIRQLEQCAGEGERGAVSLASAAE